MIVAVQAVSGISLTAQALDHLAHTVLPQAALDEQFELHLMRTTAELSSTIYDRSPADLALAEAQLALAHKADNSLALIEADEADPLLAQLRVRRRELLGRAEALLADVAPLISTPSRPPSDPQIAQLEQIEADLDDLILQRNAQIAQAMGASASAVEAPVLAARVAAPVSFAAIGLVAILVVWLLHRLIVQPVRTLANVATEIGAGTLDQQIDTSGIDEIGRLQRDLLQMKTSLRDRERAHMEHTAQIIEHQRIELELTKERDMAEAASQAKSSFLSMMSHELRTPLTAVIGYSQLMEQLVAEGDYRTVAADLHHIYSAGRHLLTLINNVLDLSRIEAGKLQLCAERVDIPDLVESIATTLRPLIEQNHNTLQISCPTHMAAMYTDPLKVRQSLLNLLGNAAKFTEAGTIHLSVERERIDGVDWVSFVIADSGIGISTDQLPKLFKPFSQIDDSLNRRYDGTGLGLALSQRLCQLLGGNITVESTFGVGSVFTMRLPAIAPADPADIPAARPPAAYVAMAAEEVVPIVSENLVLVIDDDPAVGSMIAQLIGPEHACVIYAASDADGIELARDVLPDLIFLNLLMPRIDGWQVLAALKADPELAHIPVILISIDDQRQRGFALGVADFIVKPSDPTGLAATLSWLPAPTPAPGYILIVEDDRAISDLFLRALESEGWHAVVARTGREALTTITARPPAAIMLDPLLPDIDGVQLITTLRERPGRVECPIIIVTARDMSSADRAQIQGSARQILRKGEHSPEELTRQLHCCLAASRKAAQKTKTEHPHA
jgi:signal transduction histidine kinase/DNA-binding response OmpR family regulator